MTPVIIIRDAVTVTLDRLEAKIQHPTPVAEAAAVAVASLTIRAFNDPSVRAAPWAPLTPETLARKIAAGVSTAPLKRSTLLFRSWVASADGGTGRVSTDRPYAKYHQWGTRRGLPARPMLPITGSPTAPQLTELAARNAVAAAKRALDEILEQS